MRQREVGFTLIEVLVVIAILATLAGTVVLLIPKGRAKANEHACRSNVGQIVGLLEIASDRFPDRSGPAFILYLAYRGELQGEDALETLFCPGDPEESLRYAGGEAAYAELDLNAGDLGHLTSYAAPDQSRPECRVRRGRRRPVVLIADDSGEHHEERGLVVGLTGGSVKFRDKVDRYGMRPADVLVVGEGSAVNELKCLRAD